jgi:hypothetical protein
MGEAFPSRTEVRLGTAVVLILIVTPYLVFVILITLIFSFKMAGDYALNVGLLIFMTVFVSISPKFYVSLRRG